MHDMLAVAPKFKAEHARQALGIGRSTAQEVPVIPKQAVARSIVAPGGRVVIAWVVTHDDEFGTHPPGVDLPLYLLETRHGHRANGAGGGRAAQQRPPARRVRRRSTETAAPTPRPAAVGGVRARGR